MQLALTPEVLFPLVAGAAVAIAVIAIVVALGRGRSTPADEPVDDLTAADWTGESAAGDPSAAVASRVAVVGPHRLTVAEAVAARDADTAPLPVSSSSLLGGTPVPSPATDGPATDGPATDGPTADGRVAEDPASEESATEPEPAVESAGGAGSGDVETAQPVVAPTSTPAAAASDDGSVNPEPALDAPPAAAASPWPYRPPSVPDPRAATTSTGSGQTVAVAVAHALAARAAAKEVSEVTAPPASPMAEDARDRLLAVLLDDPERAVGAVEELETSRGQLGEVLERLVASGLSVDQLARLTGFPADEVRGLLAHHQRLG